MSTSRSGPLADVWGEAEPDAPIKPEECQYAIADEAPFTDSTPYWQEKARVCQIVASHPEGAVLNHVVAQIHGKDEVSAAGAEYQRTRRFLSSHPEYFAVSKADGLVFVEPQLSLFDLINGGIIQTPTEKPSTAGIDLCRNILKSVKEVNDKGESLLEQNLQEYVDRINDLRLVLHSEEADPEYLTLPYKTRFNDEGRISKQWSIMSSALEVAGEEWSNAALLTLTTDPKKFSSIYEMVANINKNWNRLMSWLSSSSRLGYRPQYVKVLEFTQKGFPHIHAIVFLEDDSTRADGMPWLEEKAAISRYWNKYQARVVDVQPLVWQDDLGDEYGANEGWVRWRADGNHGGLIDDDRDDDRDDDGPMAQTAGQYLGKYLSAVYGGIRGVNEESFDTDAGETAGEKYEEKAATWKIAMYWATGRKIRTESRDLRALVEERMEEEDEDDLAGELAEVIREADYTFVGAYSYDRIPDHVRRGSVPIDALEDTFKEKDRTGKIVGTPPAKAIPLVEDLMEGAGMLFGAASPNPDPDPELAALGRDSDTDDSGPSVADFM